MKKRYFLLCLTIIATSCINFSFKKNKKDEKKDLSAEALAQQEEKQAYQSFRTMSDVVSLIQEKAYQAPENLASIIENALKSAMPNVDPHTAFFPQESYLSTMEATSGEFSGIGISIISKTSDDDALAIIDIIQGGPAEKAGLKPGDKIVEVEGKKLRGLSSDEAIAEIKGKTGSEVKLKIIRNKKPMELKVKRDVIKDQTSFCFHFKTPNIYYLGLKIFAATSTKQMAELLNKASEGKARGIVIDVRRNPGGILDSAIDTCNLFVDKNSLIVSTKDKKNNVTAEYKTSKDPIFKNNIPIFILIDNFTASASEILAGALKHYSEQNSKNKNKNLMVFLVGTPTFGKGSVQEVIPISNGCALKLTTLLYYLPNGQTIQALGINPDFTIKPKIVPTEDIKWIEELYGKESSLKNYINPTLRQAPADAKAMAGKQEDKQNKEPEETEKTWKQRQIESLNGDPQIQTCINMINMFDFAKKHNPKLVENRTKALKFLKENFLTDDETEIEEIKVKS
ncbi:MAG: S41 family peptidase [bacterium]